jgi:hypothetical protein
LSTNKKDGDGDAIPTKKRRGRPPKSEIVSRKRGTVGTRGRPKGDAAIINEYKTRMLTSPKSKSESWSLSLMPPWTMSIRTKPPHGS